MDEIRAEALGARAFLGPQLRRLSVNAILDKLETNYERGGKRGIPREVSPQLRSTLKRLRDYFGDLRAAALDEDKIKEFRTSLLSGGKKKATVNRSVQLLRQAYNVSLVPCGFSQLSMLDESDNVRKGKFEPAEAERVIASLPEYLADFARYAYESGSRAGEIRKLEWPWVREDYIEVPARNTKARKLRQIVITPAIEAILERREQARVTGCDLVFHRNGHAITDYRKAWKTACVVNGLGRFYCRACADALLDARRHCPRCGRYQERPVYEGKLMHDFRRSCAHELWKAGNTPEECMAVTGHEGVGMFKRYADLFKAEERREMQRKTQERRQAWQDQQLAESKPASIRVI